MFSIYSKEEIKCLTEGSNFLFKKAPKESLLSTSTDKLISTISNLDGEPIVKHYYLLEEGFYTDNKDALLLMSKFPSVSIQHLIDLLTGKLSLKELFDEGNVTEELNHMACVIDRNFQDSNLCPSDKVLETFINNSLAGLEFVFTDGFVPMSEKEKHDMRNLFVHLCTEVCSYCKENGIFMESGTYPIRPGYSGGKPFDVDAYKVDGLDDIYELINPYKEHGIYLYQLMVTPPKNYLFRFAGYTEPVNKLTKCE